MNVDTPGEHTVARGTDIVVENVYEDLQASNIVFGNI